MCCHTHVWETPKSTFKIAATTTIVALVVILVYEVYTVTDSCSECRRRPVFRDIQALLIQLNESSEEALPVVVLYKPSHSSAESDDLNSLHHRIGHGNRIYKLSEHTDRKKSSMHTNTSNMPPIPYMGNYKCQDPLCREFFSQLDKTFYTYCYERLQLVYHNTKKDKVTVKTGNCHFMNGTNRAAVALASFPGSGNTWVRGLLEQVTGICTGAVDCDYSMRNAGFNGESLRTGSVIVVDTHDTAPLWTDVNMPYNNIHSQTQSTPRYGAAILLIRNPLHALVAEWSRDVSKEGAYPGRNGLHVGQEHFGNNPKWNSFVMRKIKVWQQYFLGWAIKGLTRPVLVLRYEDLETDRIGQMKRMLDFLRVPYSEVGLQQRMTVDLGALHQQHRSDFEHFTPKQKEFVRRAISGTLEFLRRWNRGSTSTSGVAEYLKACMINA